MERGTCTDCGSAPSYRNCKSGYCLRCCDKAGHSWEQLEAMAREAAEQLRDALLAVEWRGWNEDGYDPAGDRCPVCGCKEPLGSNDPLHRPGCALDRALYNAGLPDQESRDAARALIRR